MASRRMFLVAAVAATALASAAQAELGGKASGIEADRVHMTARAAAASSRAAGSYAATALAPASGGVVTEYANSAGTVFAVSWHGPARPDLRQLLGTHFSAFQGAATGHAGRRMQRRLIVARPDLVVESAGHPGAFSGLAYIPALVPGGFTSDDVQ